MVNQWVLLWEIVERDWERTRDISQVEVGSSGLSYRITEHRAGGSAQRASVSEHIWILEIQHSSRFLIAPGHTALSRNFYLFIENLFDFFPTSEELLTTSSTGGLSLLGLMIGLLLLFVALRTASFPCSETLRTSPPIELSRFRLSLSVSLSLPLLSPFEEEMESPEVDLEMEGEEREGGERIEASLGD